MNLFFKISLLIFTLFITVDGSSITARKPLTQAAANALVDNNQWLDYMRNNRLSNAELGRIGAAFVYKGHEQFMYSPQVDFAVTALSSLTGITEGVIMLSGFAKKMILRLIAEKAAKAGMKVGKSFGKLGSIVENPGIKITGFTSSTGKIHGLNQAITRGVSPSILLNTVKNPIVVLQQGGGNYLYLTKEAAVVLNHAGRVVTTYPAAMFDSGILNILKGF